MFRDRCELSPRRHRLWQIPLPAPALPFDTAPTSGQIRFDQKWIEQVWVPAGSFKMGKDDASIQAKNALQSHPPGFVLGELPSETPQHEVKLTKGIASINIR